MWSDWVATQNIARFQQLLESETNEGGYKILAILLSDEFRKFKNL
jgi:hypothetical protein